MFEIVFPADEDLSSPIADIPAHVSIFEDEINEAVQVFLTQLDVLSAVNADLIFIEQNQLVPELMLPFSFTGCAIVDNDGKYNNYIMFTARQVRYLPQLK